MVPFVYISFPSLGAILISQNNLKCWRQYMQNFLRTPLVREFYHNADSRKDFSQSIRKQWTHCVNPISHPHINKLQLFFPNCFSKHSSAITTSKQHVLIFWDHLSETSHSSQCANGSKKLKIQENVPPHSESNQIAQRHLIT